MSRSDQELVAEALYHFDILERHLRQGDLSDQIVTDAVCLRLAAGIEVLALTSPALRDRVFGDDWPAAWATRNRISHAYSHIDPDVVRQTVAEDLPQIVAALRRERRGDGAPVA